MYTYLGILYRLVIWMLMRIPVCMVSMIMWLLQFIGCSWDPYYIYIISQLIIDFYGLFGSPLVDVEWIKYQCQCCCHFQQYSCIKECEWAFHLSLHTYGLYLHLILYLEFLLEIAQVVVINLRCPQWNIIKISWYYLIIIQFYTNNMETATPVWKLSSAYFLLVFLSA